MLDIGTVLVGFVVFLLVYYLFVGPRNIPPCPKPVWPVLGNLPMLSTVRKEGNLIYFLTELSKKHGEIFSLWFGARLAVFLNNFDVCKEALITKGDHFAERPSWMFLVEKIMKRKGIIWANGHQWKEMRKFAVVTMRDMGVGKKTLELRVQEEAGFLAEEFLSNEKKAFRPDNYLRKAVSNIICGVTFGHRYNFDDAEFTSMMDKVQFIATNFSFAAPQNFIPAMKVFPLPKNLQTILDIMDDIMGVVEKHIEAHKKTFDANNIRDFVDLYIAKECEGHTDDETFSRLNMKRTVMDLFLAGTETTSTTLNWCLIYLIAKPEIQQQIHKQLDEVVGRSRPPSLADKAKLPLLESFIMEIQRLCCIAPLGVPRSAVCDTVVCGYNIPKDTIVFVNQFAVHRDPKYFDHPDDFNPGRWIQNGKVTKLESFLPFNGGQRICIGEHLAKMELFLFLSSLLQKFRFTKEPGVNLDLKGYMGITMAPKQYNIVVVPR